MFACLAEQLKVARIYIVKRLVFLRLILVLQMLLPVQLIGAAPACAQAAPAHSSAGAAGAAASPVNLDLSSTARSQVISSRQSFQQAIIQEGGTTRTVTPNLPVTPAEYVAVMQVLHTGQQAIKLGELGNAVGGQLSLSWLTGRSVANLVLPSGVTATQDFARTANLNVIGNLNNSGNLLGYSSSAQVTNAVINATNILNNQSGLITTIAQPALNPVQPAVSQLNLSVNALQNIINAGTISSSGNLNLSAGGSIVNGPVTSAVISHAILQAANNVTLQAANITNQGLIAAQAGNLTAATAALNNAGIMQALSGSVNVRNMIGNTLSVMNAGGLIQGGRQALFETLGSSYDQNGLVAKAALDISGGTVTAPAIQLKSPDGKIDVLADSLNGRLNVSGGSAEVGTRASGSLELGDIILTGDPTFYNLAGNVVINGALSLAGQNLAIVAGGDILSGPLASSLSVSNASGNAGAMTLIAGALFTSTGPTSVLSTGSGDTTSTLTITGGSTIGGKIDLSTNGAISSLSTQSTGGGGNGGALQLIAFSGSANAAGAGTIVLPSAVSIATGGNGAGTNGNVTILAGGPSSGNAITTGNISTTGGTGGGGTITLGTQTPQLASSLSILNGVLTGTISAGSTQAASVSAGALTTTGAAVSVTSGNNFSSGAITTTGTSGGAVSLATASATSFKIAGGGANGTTGAITSSGSAGAAGNISIVNNGSSGIALSSASGLVANSAGNSAGATILLDALGSGTTGALDFSAAGPVTIAVNGAGTGGGGSVTGGSITLKGSTFSNSGGLTTLSANAGSAGTGGIITVTTTDTASDLTLSNTGAGNLSISARGGTTSGNGGTATVIAGRNLSISNVAGLNAAPTSGNGGIYTLTAGSTAASGNLTITGAFNANAAGTGGGGTMILTSKSATSFDIGGGGANGTTGALAANAAGTGAGGTISVLNVGAGGITHQTSANLSVAAATTGTGGNVTLDAQSNGGTGALTFSSTGATSITANGAGAAGGGTITLKGTSISNTGGLLTLNANAGTTGGGGTVTVSTTSTTYDLALSNTGANNVSVSAVGGSTSGAGGKAIFSSGRNLTLNNALGLSLSPTSGNGGFLSISTKSATAFNIGGGGANGTSVALSLNAATSGNGGTVNIANSGTGGITLPSSANLSVSALVSGAGGTVTLDATSNGGTGSLTFSNLAATTISVNGVGSAAGGSNGGTITLKGATISNSGGLLTLSANAGTVGNGGTVTAATSGATSDLTISNSGASNIAASATGGSTSGNGGSVNFTAGRTLTISNTSGLAVTPTSGNGGNYSLVAGASAAGNLVFTGNMTLNANAVSTGGVAAVNGGTITLQGASITDASGLINLNANGPSGGSKTGSGGQVTVTTTGATANIVLNNAGNGNFDVSATGGATSGNGGVVTLSAGQNITVTNLSNSLTAAPVSGNGAQLTFTAGTAAASGTVLIDAALSANAAGTGDGGLVSITTKSATALTITAGSTNGVAGNSISVASATSGKGGTITLANTGTGGIDLSQAGSTLTLTSTSNGAGGTLNLSAPNGTLNLGANGITISGNGSGLGGTATISASTLSNSGVQTINANGGTSGSGNPSGIVITAGSINLSRTLTLNSRGQGTGSGGFVSVSTTGATADINTRKLIVDVRGGATSGGGGTVTLSAGRNLTITQSQISSGPQAGNSNGSSFNYTAGTASGATTGRVQVTGRISADATGNGNAGTIAISYKDNTTNDNATGYNFQVGNNSANNFVDDTSGGLLSLTAQAPGNGNAGTISVTNTNSATGVAMDILDTVNGASAGSGSRGIFNVVGGTGPVTVFLENSATVTSAFGGSGSAYTLTDPDTTWLGAITTSAGAVNITTQAGTSPQINVNYGATISATGGAISFDTPQVINNGSLVSTGSGNGITLRSTTGAFILNGLGHLRAPAATILVSALSGNQLSLSSSHTFDTGTGGTVTFSSAGGAGSIIMGAGVVETFLSNSTVNFNTRQFVLAQDCQLYGFGMTSQPMNFNGDAAAGLDLQVPAGFSSTVSTAGGQINFAMPNGQPLTFDTTNVAGSAATLFVKGAPLVATANGAQINLVQNLTVQSDNNVTFTTSGGTSGSTTSDININGFLQTSSGSGVITLQSSTNLSIGENGGLTGNQLILQTTSGHNGNIVLNANINGTTSATAAADGSGNITFVNTLLTNIVAGIGTNPKGVTVSPNNRYVYIANQNSDTISTVDTSTNTVVSVVNVQQPSLPTNPLFPLGVAVTPDGKTLYVADNGNTTNDQNTVEVLSLTNPASPVLTTTVISLGSDPRAWNPHSIAISPNGKYAYVTSQGSNGQAAGTNNFVSVVDTTNNTVVSQILVGNQPKGIDFNPAGTSAFIANSGSNSVSVIDTGLAISNPGAAVVATIPVGTTPRGVAANPAGLWVYVANQGSNTLSVIDTSANKVIATVPVGSVPNAVSVNQAGTLVYVANQGSNNVSVVDTASMLQIATPIAGSAPFPIGSYLSFVGVNNVAYIPNGGSNNVSVLRFPTINSPSVTLSSGTGVINSATNATSLSANSGGNVYISESNNVALVNPPTGTAQNSGAIFQMGSTNSITVNSPINATATVLQTVFANQGISVNQNITSSGAILSPAPGPPAGTPPLYSVLFIVGDGGTVTDTAQILSQSTNGSSFWPSPPNTPYTIQIQGQGALNLAASGNYNPGANNTVFIVAPVSLTFVNGVNHVATTGNIVVQTPKVIGNANGSGILSATNGNITINSSPPSTITNNPYLDLVFQPDTVGAATTINLNGVNVTTNSINLTVNAAATVATTGVFTGNILGTTLTNNGTISSSASGGASSNGVVASFNAPGNLTVAGTGIYGTSGAASGAGVVPSVQFSVSGASALNITGSNTFASGVGGVNFVATNGSITFSSGTKQTMTSGLYFYLSSPSITLPTGTVLDQSAAPNSTISIDGGGSGPLNLVLPSGTTTVVSGSYGTYFTTNADNQAMSITSAGTSTLNVNGGPAYFVTYTGNQTIGPNVTIASNNNIEFDMVGSGTFTVNGSIQATTPTSQILLNGFGGTVTMAGTPGLIGGGTKLILVEADNINVSSNYTFNASGGNVYITTAQSTTTGLAVANGITIKADGGSFLTVGTAVLTLGSNSTLWGTASSGTAVNVQYIVGGNAGSTTVNLPGAGNTANLQSSGGLINVQATGSLTFANPNGGNTILNCTGGSFTAQSDAGALTIATGVTLKDSANMTFYLNNSSQFTDSGTITSTGSGANISILGGGATTSGSFVMAGSPQPITVTGNGSIFVEGYTGLQINSSYSFSVGGANGLLTLASPVSIALASGKTVSLTGGGVININAQQLTLSSGSVISTDQSSSVGMTVGTGVALATINVDGGATGTLQTSGGTISVAGGKGLTFARTAATSGTATLQVNGGAVSESIGSGTLTVGANFSLTSNRVLTLTTPFASVVNNGTISGTAASGSNGIVINSPSLTNNGTITASTGANISINNNADLTISGANGLITPAGSGAVNITSNFGSVNITQQQISGTLTGTAARAYSVSTANGNLTVGSISANFGNLSLVSGTTASGSASTLTVASGATLSANEGNTLVEHADTSKGLIVVGNSSVVKAYTATTNTALGNTSIVIGAVPGSPTNLDPSQRPSNVLVNTVGTGKIYWGTSNTVGSSIVANPTTNTINAFNRTVIFNVGATRPPSAITLNGAVTVVADPPAPGAVIIYATSLIPHEQPAPELHLTIPPAHTSSSASPMDMLVGGAGHWHEEGYSALESGLIVDELEAAITGSFDTAGLRRQERRRLQDEIGREDAEDDDSDDQYSPLQPIAFFPPEAGGQQNRVAVLHTLETSEGLIKHSGHVRLLRDKAGTMTVRSGEAFIATAKRTAIKCGKAVIYAEKGAYLLLSRIGRITTIRNLHERQSGSVRLVSGNKYVVVAAGQEVIIAPTEADLAGAVSQDAVGRRRAHVTSLPDGSKAQLSEISLISVMGKNGILSTMLHSEESADRKIAKQVIKMAACLVYTTAAHGAYSTAN